MAECQWKYSFNYIKGAAHTDGEVPERGWSTLNAVASSTKEMGPGRHRDTLDDLMGNSNWKKVVGIAVCIVKLTFMARRVASAQTEGSSFRAK